MDRRLFVKLSAFSAAAISLSLNGCQTNSIQKEIASPDLLSHLLEKETLIQVGEAYLIHAPIEKEADKIIPLLLTDSKINETSDPTLIRSFLIDKVTQDFKTGKTVVVNGWILSVTEARQCALFYLIQN